MHKAIFAAVAAAALAAPVAAQQMNPNTTSPPENGLGPPPAQPNDVQGAPPAVTDHSIAPRLLDQGQIRDIQQALEARGAHRIRVDGQWGPDVEAAIRNFQKAENMISQNGELDTLTLLALGLDPLTFSMPPASETTGQAVRDSATRPDGRERIQQHMRDAPERPISGSEQDQ